MCGGEPVCARKADRSSEYRQIYIVKTNRIAVEVDLDSGPGRILVNAFDPADLPFVFVEGIDVVVRFELLVEVVHFELRRGFSQHSLIYIEKDLF